MGVVVVSVVVVSVVVVSSTQNALDCRLNAATTLEHAPAVYTQLTKYVLPCTDSAALVPQYRFTVVVQGSAAPLAVVYVAVMNPCVAVPAEAGADCMTGKLLEHCPDSTC